MSRTRGTLLPRERAGLIASEQAIKALVWDNPARQVYASLGEARAQGKRPCAVHQRADRCWMRRRAA